MSWVNSANKGCSNRDYPLSQLRIVKVSILEPTERAQGIRHDDHPQIHYMHESQVDAFVYAKIQLHHVVGNPHHRDAEGKPIECKLDNLWEIKVARLDTQTISYWWSAPSLQSNDPLSAKLNQLTFFERIWAHPELTAYEDRLQAEEARREYLADIGESS